VPAPAVIPALRVYANTAVVKTFVVYIRMGSPVSNLLQLQLLLPEWWFVGRFPVEGFISVYSGAVVTAPLPEA